MWRGRLRLLCALALCAMSFGCQEKVVDEIGFGAVEDGVYRNKYFGMAVAIPSGWSIQDRKSTDAIAEIGEKAIAGDDENMQAVLKAGDIRTLYLLTVFRHPLGTPVEFNPSIICVAERIRHMPGIKRGSDYLFHARKLLEAGQMKFTFPGEVYPETIGGVEFDVLEVHTSLPTGTVKQKYYATVIKGYALNLILSFGTEEEESALDAILGSATFEQK